MRKKRLESNEKCVCCGNKLRWLADFSPEEYGWQGVEGIISEYICDKCGAEHVVCVPIGSEPPEERKHELR